MESLEYMTSKNEVKAVESKHNYYIVETIDAK